MAKKYVELKVGDDVVAILPIKECSGLEFIEKQKVAAQNYANLVALVKLYELRISELEKEVKILKGED